MIFLENDRKNIWDKLSSCEFQIHNLKGLVQNEYDIPKEDFIQWNEMMEMLLEKLNEASIIVNTYNQILVLFE